MANQHRTLILKFFFLSPNTNKKKKWTFFLHSLARKNVHDFNTFTFKFSKVILFAFTNDEEGQKELSFWRKFIHLPNICLCLHTFHFTSYADSYWETNKWPNMWEWKWNWTLRIERNLFIPFCHKILHEQYFEWNRKRINNVVQKKGEKLKGAINQVNPFFYCSVNYHTVNVWTWTKMHCCDSLIVLSAWNATIGFILNFMSFAN